MSILYQQILDPSVAALLYFRFNSAIASNAQWRLISVQFNCELARILVFAGPAGRQSTIFADHIIGGPSRAIVPVCLSGCLSVKKLLKVN